MFLRAGCAQPVVASLPCQLELAASKHLPARVSFSGLEFASTLAPPSSRMLHQSLRSTTAILAIFLLVQMHSDNMESAPLVVLELASPVGFGFL